MKKWLSLAASALLVASFSGCGDENEVENENNETVAGVTATKVEFIGMDAPSTNEDMSKTYSTATARVYTSDTAYTDYPLEYNRLFGIKDKVGTNPNPAGQLYNYKMEPLLDNDGAPRIAETPDANSLLNIDGKLFMVSHLEYDWINSDGSRLSTRMPMNMILTDIKQESNGKLTAVDQKPIDHSSVNGGWIFCFGSQTPWNTHLGGEEDYDLYFTEASGSKISKTTSGIDVMTNTYFKNEKLATMYHYGYHQEVVVKKDGSYDLHKRYAMGKGTWEMAQIFGDGKTAIYGDDGEQVLMTMFVADKAEDLSAGTLYAAKWTQTNAAGATDGGQANLSWVKLGQATEAEIKEYADTLEFSDIFEYLTPAQVDANVSTEGYTRIRAGHSGDEYLKLKPGMAKAAAFLETRRYAAMRGATTEFNKMEGIAINNTDKIAYVAMSYIDRGMIDDADAPANHIKVAKNNCGGTYEIPLAGGQKDTDGNPINSEYVGTSMYVPAALLGEEIATDAKGNTCKVDKIANTDNTFFSEKMRTLFIGEDSGTHVNNFLWAYNIDTKKLSRIASIVSGGEATGLQVVENLNGHAYIMGNDQHNADFLKTMPDTLKAELGTQIDKFDAGFGYIGGIPGLK
mgnify:CR=1 FL=1